MCRLHRDIFTEPSFRRLHPLLNAVLNLVFPMDCVVCGEAARDWRRGPLCARCEGGFTALEAPFCLRCGLGVAVPETLCGACLTERTQFDLGRSALVFDPRLRQVIHHFKYNDRVSLARPLGRALLACLGREHFTAECVVAVPLHRSREMGRGYNQAALLAARLCLRSEPDMIRRRKNTESQTGLSRAQRLGNVRGAFECRRRVKGRVLVVDDVATTGATLNEVARVLKRAGASRVEAITVARAGQQQGSVTRDGREEREEGDF